MGAEQKVNILLVDDRLENLKALEAILGDLGQNLVKAHSGQEALRLLLHNEFALILLDVQMPGMDGFETATLIRKCEKSEHTPIIFLTAIDKSDTYVFKGYSLGAVDYILKPFEPEVLKAKVRVFIDLFKKRQEVERQAEEIKKLNEGLERRVRERTAELEAANRELENEITERKRAEERRVRQAALRADVSVALGESDTSLRKILKRCAEAMVQHLDAAFARIWTLNKEGNVLELQASAGMYTHIDGPHSRVPVGKLKIGLIAQERRPHSTNDVIHDSRISDKEWAKREGMVAFAGYPLIVEDRLVGVMAMFAREPLTENTVDALASIADAIAQGIERKQVEEERARLLIGERAARAEAEAANRTKDEFLATISHELRSPLTSMLGWVRLLRSGHLNQADSARALETIERNAKAQAQLVEDLLDVSRIITGKLRLDVRPVDLVSVIEAAVDAVRPAADAKVVRVHRVFDPSVGPVLGDADRLHQVVWNLLSNAIKFTPKEGRVEVRLERADSEIQVRVRDTGVGIRPDFLPYVFDRFRQADSTTTRKHGGLGLGLAIVRHLVELHGGTVHAESPGEGQGATFTVKLPIRAGRMEAVDSERVRATVGAGVPSGKSSALDGLRVLVVDDEADAREFLTLALEQFGAEVTAVASAGQALDALERWKPDVLVSDIGMPGEDGYDMIRKVRTLAPERGGRIPAVALTAYARVEDRLRALSAGYQMHVPKPVEPVELAAVVASVGRTGRFERTSWT